MSFLVSITDAPVNFEALPVAKIVDYPLEKRDYKPFAQCCVCVSEGRLSLRMWSFEVSPAAESELRGVFYIFAETPGAALHATIHPPEDDGGDNRVGVWIQSGGIVTPVTEITTNMHNGEDLQGVYWGADIFIPLEWLEKTAGKLLLDPGSSFDGNFYKTCQNKDSTHYGSFYPADFTGNDPYGQTSTGNFVVVTY